jgi:uncharacterized protein (TIGR03085 family)
MLAIKGVEPSLRAAFAGVCTEVGPDAPTLCTGWTVRDLVIHMYLIEHRWDSWPAVPLGNRFRVVRDIYDRLVERERTREWPQLVDRIRSGPKTNPLASQWLRDRMMPREYLIHTEDVRRANGIDAKVNDDAQEIAWSRLLGLAKRLFLTTGPYGLALASNGKRFTLKSGQPTATLVGDPLELLLYVFGRTSVARVELTGDSLAVAAAHARDTSKFAQSLPRISNP